MTGTLRPILHLSGKPLHEGLSRMSVARRPCWQWGTRVAVCLTAAVTTVLASGCGGEVATRAEAGRPGSDAFAQIVVVVDRPATTDDLAPSLRVQAQAHFVRHRSLERTD